QVYEVAAPHGVPIIGQGGVTTVNDALEFLIAGAAAVGIGTALFYEPLILKTLNAGILEYLAANGMMNVSELVGTLSTARDIDCGVGGGRPSPPPPRPAPPPPRPPSRSRCTPRPVRRPPRTSPRASSSTRASSRSGAATPRSPWSSSPTTSARSAGAS